jgi:hypothetical protein
MRMDLTHLVVTEGAYDVSGAGCVCSMNCANDACLNRGPPRGASSGADGSSTGASSPMVPARGVRCSHGARDKPRPSPISIDGLS